MVKTRESSGTAHKRRLPLPLTAGALAGAVIVGGLVMAPATFLASAPSANAVVSQGHGVQGTYGHIGSLFESSTGQFVYCLDSSLGVPFGNESTPTQVGSVAADPNVVNAIDAGPDAVGRMNYILSTWGQTTDDAQAAAVYLAVNAYVKSGGMNEMATYSTDQGITDLAWSMFNQSQAIAVGGSGSGQVSGTGVLTVDPKNNYVGTININGTAGANVTITLTNGLFDSTGTNTLTNATSNTDYAVHGVPPTDDGAPYKISGSFTLKAGSGSAWPTTINLYNYGAGQQRLGGAVGAVNTEQTITGEFNDPMTRSTVFQPIVKTTATQFVKKGEKFTDVWHFGTQPSADGLNNDWFKSPSTGNYAPITADAKIYGPFKELPAESVNAPAGAPVAATATQTTDLKSGPTVDYTVSGDKVAAASGYYTWQTSITDTRQTDTVRKFLIPSPYSWMDRFAQTVESSLVPMTITGSTKVKAPEVALSGVPGDTAAIANDGIWLQKDGKNVPVTVKWDAYWDKSLDGPKQVPASQIPAAAVKLGTVTQTVSAPGDIKTPDTAKDTGFTAPAAGTGSIVWVLHIDAADNAGMVEDWSDDYGVPSEIQKIAQPTTKTQATPGAKPGTDTKDTAEVGGTLPADGAELTFQQYEVPMVKDASGKWVINAPKGTAAGDLSWVCTADNQKYSNVGKGQVVVKTGKYDSPNVKITEGKKYLWVEKLWSVPSKEGDKPQLIAEGKCGVPTETTFGLTVTTKAQTSDASSPTPTVHDTGVIKGYVPEGGKVVVDAYRGEQCTADTKIWTSKEIVLGGGYFPDGYEFTTDTFQVKGSSTASTISFWEKVYDAQDRLVAQGGCNMPDETVKVPAQPGLALTGDSTSLPLALGGGGVLVLGVGLIIANALVRRRKAAALAGDVEHRSTFIDSPQGE